jgi:hypothetical protein
VELVVVNLPKDRDRITIAPLGDVQYSGPDGPTADGHLTRHIDRCLALDAWFIGMGDYIDFASPSNRARLRSANLYDTAQEVVEKAADNLVDEVFAKFLKPTVGRWLGLLEGHHFFEFGGRTSDTLLAEKLKTRQLGTSCFIHLKPCGVTIWAHHGLGGGSLPAAPLNKLYHAAAGLEGADIYLMGHTTKMPVVRLSRPRPCWDTTPPTLKHRDIFLINTGGFSRSNVPFSRHGAIPRGDYAEAGMMTPSPLSAPLIHIDTKAKRLEDRIRVEV